MPHGLAVVLRARALADDLGACDRRGPEGSYTARLLDEGTAACARKVGEEAVEVVTAALAESDERLVEEAADLVYHLYVLLASRGVDLAAVEDELAGRSR